MIVALDPTELDSELTDTTGQLEATKAEIARRIAAIGLVSALKPGTTDIAVPPIFWSPDIPERFRTREQRVLENDLLQLRAGLSSSVSQIAQKQADAISIAATIGAQQGLVDTLSDLASMRQTLVSKQAGSKADWLDALQTQKTQEVVLATDVEQQADNAASINILKQDEAKTIGDFLADYTQKLADAEKTADDLEQKVRQAQSQLDQMTLKSPIDGIVQASAVTTVGQVVTTGQELMRIVPAATSIDIQAYLPNDEIGFVAVGQTAAVKIAAFPYTQYGTIPGRVISVGRDAVTAADAEQALEDPTHVGAAANVAGTAAQTDNLVFPITIRLDRDFISVNGTTVPFSPGMGASVDIDTGNRRILEYLFSPVIDVTSSALHERSA
jgi:hemolysin D